MGVMRIGHVSLKVMDLDAAVRHYEDVIGMKTTHREKGAAYLKCWDEWDKYSLILNASDRAGLNYVAYKVETESDLDTLKKRIKDRGTAVEDLPANAALPFCGKGIRFSLPSGHQMCLFAKKETVGKDVGTTNPEPWPDDLRGVGAHWLDHCLLMAEVNPEKGINRVADNTKFVMEALDFHLAEQVVAGPGGAVQLATWLFRTTTPHDIAFAPGPHPGLHHLAFFLDDWSSIKHAADVMAKKKVRIDVPPTRHGITRGETIYFFDPSGNRNETFCGLGYLAQPDMPVITWTEDQLARGIFYHTGQLQETFLTAYT